MCQYSITQWINFPCCIILLLFLAPESSFGQGSSPDFSFSQEEKIQEKLRLENYQIKFGLGRGFKNFEEIQYENSNGFFFRPLSDSLRVTGTTESRLGFQRKFSAYALGFFEISRTFKPFDNNWQLSLGVRHMRAGISYRTDLVSRELLSEIITDTIPIPPIQEPMPVIIDGFECDTLLNNATSEFRPNEVLIGHVGLTPKLNRSFFNEKLAVTVGVDLMFAYWMRHRRFYQEWNAGAHPVINGVVCSLQPRSEELEPISSFYIIPNASIQYFPFRKFGIELQASKHVNNIFVNTPDFDSRPFTLQVGLIFRFHDEYIEKKKLGFKERFGK